MYHQWLANSALRYAYQSGNNVFTRVEDENKICCFLLTYNVKYK